MSKDYLHFNFPNKQKHQVWIQNDQQVKKRPSTKRSIKRAVLLRKVKLRTQESEPKFHKALSGAH